MANAKGKITQVIGAVVDVQFDDRPARDPQRAKPPTITVKNWFWKLPSTLVKTLFVQSRWTHPKVWFAAKAVVDTGAPISVPVGNATLGRILNVVGEPVDEKGPVNADETAQSTNQHLNSANNQLSQKSW